MNDSIAQEQATAAVAWSRQQDAQKDRRCALLLGTLSVVGEMMSENYTGVSFGEAATNDDVAKQVGD